MIDIVERLRFDAARCEVMFSKGIASNIDAGADEIERLIRRVAALEMIIREELPPLSCACDANRMLVDDIHAAVGTP